MSPLSVQARRAELLVLSDLTAARTDYGATEVRAAIARVVVQHHGVHDAIADAAAEMGDHPDLFVVRLHWAIGVVAATFTPRRHSNVTRKTGTTASA